MQINLKTIEALAQKLGISTARAYELIRRNCFRINYDGPDVIVRLGQRQLRYNPEALDLWLAQGGNAGNAGGEETK